MTHRTRLQPGLIVTLVLILVFAGLPASAAPAPLVAPLGFGDVSRLFTVDAPDSLGSSVAIDGDTALVGAPHDGSKGSVYVFTRSGSSWVQRAKITAPDASWDDMFGYSVALSNGTAVIGAAGDDSIAGSAYVFTGGGALWNYQTKLLASDRAAWHRFGHSVALSNGTVVIGAPEVQDCAGAAYVFTGSGASWSQQAKLSGTAAGYAMFGDAVALSGDTALIGAYTSNSYNGAAYLFTRSGTAWSLQKTFTPTDAADRTYGSAVALSGSTAIIGAAGYSSYRGAAYVFTGGGASWTQQRRLTASDGAADDSFGDSVALSGDTAVIGAWGDSDHGLYSGSSYVFRGSGSNWTQLRKTAGGDVSNRRFGWDVAVSGSNAVIGACGFHQPDVEGRAYVLDLNHPPTAVSDQASCDVSAMTFIPVLANDSDPDGDALSVAGFTQPTHGTLSHYPVTGQLLYIPEPGWSGTDYFTYTATDGKDVSTATWVNVTVGSGTGSPVLAPIPDVAIDELESLTFTASATDEDLPFDMLTFALGGGAPAGASINSSGDFSWTPSEAQGPGSYDITVTVTDWNENTDSDTFTVTVGEANADPVLSPIGDRSVDELSPLTFAVSASDGDLPANSLGFNLGMGAPSGASIDPVGVFSWTPSEAQGPGTYDITVIVSDGEGGSDSETITISVGEVSCVVTPVQGATRIDTAIAASNLAFDSSEYALVATAYNWPDALGGAALAGALDAPILLSSPTTLTAGLAQEIGRLGAAKVIVLGGTGAISPSVTDALGDLPGVSVERIAGDSRYETANEIAARTIAETDMRGGYDGSAFVVTGANFPDALGASPLAAAKGWPIYLADPNGDNAELALVMDAAGVTEAIVLGGTGAVSPSVEATLAAAVGSASRIAGADRYATASLVAGYGVTKAGLSWNKLAIATGHDFPDALAGGVLQGESSSVMLLTPPNLLDAGVASILATNREAISEIRFVGGTGAVSDAVRAAVLLVLE